MASSLFSVEVFDTAYNPVAHPFSLIHQRHAAEAETGYTTADMTVEGDAGQMEMLRRWLGYYVVVRNQRLNVIWAGKITGISYPKGTKLYKLTLDDMSNRIAVTWSQEDADGNTVSGVTPYADNLDSQSRYGIKEMLKSAGDLDEALALAQRDEALRALGEPLEDTDLYGAATGSTGFPTGQLMCRGLGDSFTWRIFNQPGGVVRHESNGGFEHLLGWGVVASATVGFNNAGGSHRISRLLGGLDALRPDDVIIVGGAANAANNGTFTVAGGVSQEAESYTATSIAFDPVDDINDSGAGLGFVQSHELIFLTTAGSEGWKNRYFWVHDETGSGHITVRPAMIGTQSAGPSVAIQQGHSVTVTPATLVQEFPGAAIDITALGTAVAQSFSLPVDVPFVVQEAWVRLKRVGSPADSVRCTLYTNGAGVPSGTTLENVTVLGSTISDKNMVWVKFAFTTSPSLAFGTVYWIGIERTGANSPTDYYLLDLDEDSGFSGGFLKLWNGSAWVDRPASADMPFQIWAKRQTTDQLTDIYNASNQFCRALEIQVASGRYSRLFRDKDLDAQQEMLKLMRAGVLNGRRLLSRVSADRIMSIYEEPIYNADSAPIFTEEGELVSVDGQPYEPGRLPAGEWIVIAGEPPQRAGKLIEKAEYDATQGRYTQLMPKGAVDPFDVVRLV